MTLQKNYPIANLSEGQLQKIQRLEKELSQEKNENIVLIAYDEKE
ncbi:hypothetical protein [Calidifontibacillus erzurumensis]|nr:hypothetical protein [Calidifontibacillus erzurumensis]